MKLSQFKFKLPEEKIALYPTHFRDECKLMVVHKSTGEIEHKTFKDVLNYFDDKDVFIFNDTKVFPARLYGNKEKTGARIEVFLLRELNEQFLRIRSDSSKPCTDNAEIFQKRVRRPHLQQEMYSQIL